MSELWPFWKRQSFPYWLLPESVWCWYCYSASRWIDDNRCVGDEPYGWLEACKSAVKCAAQIGGAAEATDVLDADGCRHESFIDAALSIEEDS